MRNSPKIVLLYRKDRITKKIKEKTKNSIK
jgi:hypothetical protein